MATTQTRPRRPAPPKTEARRAEAPAKRSLPPLATSVVGSSSVPEWLERLKTDYYQRRISRAYLHEIYEVAIKAALKDQEVAGVDVVSDGELRRDNDIDYFLARLPGSSPPPPRGPRPGPPPRGWKMARRRWAWWTTSSSRASTPSG